MLLTLRSKDSGPNKIVPNVDDYCFLEYKCLYDGQPYFNHLYAAQKIALLDQTVEWSYCPVP